MLRTVLSGAGYSVLVASDGNEAFKMVEEKIPDLIILDIMMPEMDGSEVASILKSDQKTNHIPIIFLSALITKKEEKIVSKTDKISFLSKPYNRDILLNEVGKHFR